MPEAVQTPSHSQARRPSQWLTLNTDGQPHMVLNALSVGTLIVGAVGFALGLIVRTHFPATVLGIAAFVVGMAAQMNSATRGERILIVTGMIAGFVGLAVGVAHGGFA